jgi:hypothetical protein
MKMATITIEMPDKLAKRLSEESRKLGISENARIVKLLEQAITPYELMKPGMIEKGMPKLTAFLSRIPGLSVISNSRPNESQWWVKLDIDITSEFAWHVVQELGFVLNYISLTEVLPTVFKPVSPPPYLNGGPQEMLSWVIESSMPFVDPALIALELEARLPSPVDDVEQWRDLDS